MKRNIFRIVYMITAMLFMAVFFAGCSQGSQIAGNNEKLQIVTTIFPVYDWVENVLGDNPAGAEVTMLLDNGVDLHSFQPTAEDIVKISTCDVFIYVGGESDEWVEDALQEAVNKDMVVINLMDVIGNRAKEEEFVEGMQEDSHEHEEHEDADHEDHEEHEDADHEDAGHEEEHHHDEEEAEYDEHIWLSLQNAEICVNIISEKLSEKDPVNKEVYTNNAMQYNSELKSLDEKYRDVAENADVKTLLFADRFPFRYLTEDYGLDYYAAFIGCSAETEASFETVTFLANKTDELGLKHILVIESSDGKIAETVISNTKEKNQQICRMDSLQSVTAKDKESGVTYLSVMQNNLEVLKEALSQ